MNEAAERRLEIAGETIIGNQEHVRLLGVRLADVKEQLQSALATIEVLQDKEALSDILASQTEELDGLKEQVETLLANESDWSDQARRYCEQIARLKEQFDALRAAVQKELDYMDGFPDVEDGSPLGLVIESLRLALASGPAEIRDSGITLDFARGEVRKRDESSPATSSEGLSPAATAGADMSVSPSEGSSPAREPKAS